MEKDVQKTFPFNLKAGNDFCFSRVAFHFLGRHRFFFRLFRVFYVVSRGCYSSAIYDVKKIPEACLIE